MKITIFNGSPRGASSNSRVLTDAFAEGAASAGAEIETVNLIEKNIGHCRGCFACWKKTPGRCVQRDDMDELLDKYKSSDAVIYATPVYLWNVTACLKNFLDRLIPTKSAAVVEDEGDFDMENSVKKLPDVIIIANAGFPGNNNFEIMKAVVRPAEPVLEIYRNSGMLLRTGDESVREKVDEYLTFVKKAGSSIASGLTVSQEILEGLNRELMPIEQYVQYISG